MLVTSQTKDHCFSIAHSKLIRSSPNHRWSPPLDGWIKINMDASFVDGNAFTAAVIRNRNGSILLASTAIHRCSDPLAAECIAILDACLIIHNLSIKNVYFESDCSNAINLINSNSASGFWTAHPIVEKIKKTWNGWPSWIFKYSPRSTNRAAHELAKWTANSLSVGLISLDAIPISVF
ncbi:hypothetical protein CASFOL_009726 [Castilleja foliolosa]|uniref:RNase H type-1 domain-containing protein n=1 Tax=Castilleja foliolosa TaxID=1961234 RepID=A0ABD3DUM4_9LAMI